jgi:hypothetical protein
MSETIDGGCQCGQVRYHITGPTAFAGVCHCDDCKKANGSAFAMVLGVPTEALAVEGSVTEYEVTADSGNKVTRGFCPTCGSRLFQATTAMPGLSMVQMGTLDDPEVAPMQMHIFCDSKLDWVVVPEGVGRFPGMPG